VFSLRSFRASTCRDWPGLLSVVFDFVWPPDEAVARSFAGRLGRDFSVIPHFPSPAQPPPSFSGPVLLVFDNRFRLAALELSATE
jgi:hypothetical protein